MSTTHDVLRMQEEELQQLQQRAEELRVKYDQWFMAIEKREPGFLREQLERDIRRSKLHLTMRTSLRFKFQMFVARYQTYAQYWERVKREMEEGTFRRGFMSQQQRLADFRAGLAHARAEGTAPPGGASSEGPPDEELDEEQRRLRKTADKAQEFLSALLQGQSPERRPHRPPPVPTQPYSAAVRPADAGTAPPSPGPSPSRPGPPPLPPSSRPAPPAPAPTKRLFDEYLTAKSRRGEDITRLSFERFQRSIEKQRKDAEQRLGAGVDFHVKVTDDKVSVVARKAHKDPD